MCHLRKRLFDMKGVFKVRKCVVFCWLSSGFCFCHADFEQPQKATNALISQAEISSCPPGSAVNKNW